MGVGSKEGRAKERQERGEDEGEGRKEGGGRKEAEAVKRILRK